MLRAIEAARAARGRTSPNPWVGAALVRDGAVIATGSTSPYGGPHAEASALANADARGATLYTTLEPCVPFEGKRTPPCSEAIIAAGVAKVVVGIIDPHVGGPGVARLREAGLEVEIGDGEAEITELMRPYLKFRATDRPYVIAKFAVSIDGRVGAPAAGIRWLTSEPALARAHADRDWIDAMMVGSGTVLSDDPALTARPGGAEASRQPVRVILDARGRSPVSARVFGTSGKAIVATTREAPAEWRAAVAASGATLLDLEPGEGGVNLDQLLETLARRGIMSLIAEGGPTVLASLFEGGHVDEVHAYVAPRILGEDGIPLALPGVGPLSLQDAVIEPLAPDVLIRGYTGAWAHRLAL